MSTRFLRVVTVLFFCPQLIVAQPLNKKSYVPDTVSNFQINSENGTAVLTWEKVEGSTKYFIYFAEEEIQDLNTSNILKIDSLFTGDTLQYKHKIIAPHFTYAQQYQAYYAITSISESGEESIPVSKKITHDLNVSSNFGINISPDALDAFFDMISENIIADESVIKSFSPNSYEPFTINNYRRFVDVGSESAINGDGDLSGQFWVWFDNESQYLVIYAEINDDTLNFISSDTLTSEFSNYDSWELSIGNYEPDSFFWSSSHTSFQRGDEPDYLIKTGFHTNSDAYLYDVINNRMIENSLTVGEITDYGYRTLAVISMIELSKDFDGEEVDYPFSFPEGYNDVAIYPFNISINDNDSGVRDHQLSWSNKAGDGTWSVNPSKWQGVVFLEFLEPLSIEYNNSVTNELKLRQNYPNPFNPATEISFILPKASVVKLEVFNLLGEKVVTLLNRKMKSGLQSVSFDASNLSSGVYMYRIQADGLVQTKKMLLIK